MADDDYDLFGLFLALGEARIGDARAALATRDRARLSGALIPLAVDAALLGAEGVAALARAIVDADGDVSSALDLLASAVASLGQGDASGARANESELVACARALGH